MEDRPLTKEDVQKLLVCAAQLMQAAKQTLEQADRVLRSQDARRAAAEAAAKPAPPPQPRHTPPKPPKPKEKPKPYVGPSSHLEHWRHR